MRQQTAVFTFSPCNQTICRQKEQLFAFSLQTAMWTPSGGGGRGSCPLSSCLYLPESSREGREASSLGQPSQPWAQRRRDCGPRLIRFLLLVVVRFQGPFPVSFTRIKCTDTREVNHGLFLFFLGNLVFENLQT